MIKYLFKLYQNKFLYLTNIYRYCNGEKKIGLKKCSKFDEEQTKKIFEEKFFQ